MSEVLWAVVRWSRKVRLGWECRRFWMRFKERWSINVRVAVPTNNFFWLCCIILIICVFNFMFESCVVTYWYWWYFLNICFIYVATYDSLQHFAGNICFDAFKPYYSIYEKQVCYLINTYSISRFVTFWIINILNYIFWTVMKIFRLYFLNHIFTSFRQTKTKLFFP